MWITKDREYKKLWRRLFDRPINILQTFIRKPSTTKQLRRGWSKMAPSLLFYFVSLTCCSITMTTNSPIKHRKKPGAIPCHSATKKSVKKCERSLFPRKRSLLYKYLVVKIRWQYQFLEILESCNTIINRIRFTKRYTIKQTGDEN